MSVYKKTSVIDLMMLVTSRPMLDGVQFSRDRLLMDPMV